ncbi:hypothetical protein H7F15_08415 [Pontibacter sp. Tf4]|uniref:hypothetical protein n=1 Tax=Pontibacter sp. Tf4 TaxID=2761620 RepID=UPI001628899B|nr:hypothetical protein [Pontibacter sp. Tf4]MBB6611056.1 hypothetical protein [Pontibacter sp. Tf4]
MNTGYVLPFLLLAAAGFSLAPAPQKPPVTIHTSGTYIVQLQDTTTQATEKKKKKRKVSGKADVKTSKVLMKRNVKSASLVKKHGEGNIIEVIVTDSGMPLHNLQDLQMTGSSGSTMSLSNFQSFENVTLPFEGIFKFRSVNTMGSVVYDREVRFTVTEPGRWVLRIDV